MPTSETALQNLEDRVYTLNKRNVSFHLRYITQNILYISIDAYSRYNQFYGYCLTNTRKYIYN